MLGYALRRLLLVPPTLLGISLLTFLLLNLAPGRHAASAEAPGELPSLRAAHERLEQAWDLRDPATGELRAWTTRYGMWLARALRFDFAGPGEDPRLLRERFARALQVTGLLAGLALLLAVPLGILLGARLGMRAGRPGERLASGLVLGLHALPEFLVATLLLLTFGSWLPGVGLQSDGAEQWPLGARVLDLLLHLVLPVVSLALGPFVLVVRWVRDAVRSRAHGDLAGALRGFGMPDAVVEQRVLANSLAPLLTVLGAFVPLLVAGSVVVERVFAIDGMGSLAWQAFRERDQSVVMAVAILSTLATLLGFLVSDLLHAAVDPRVRLGR